MRYTNAIPFLGFVAALSLAFATRAETAWQFSGVERVVAVSDIHGAYSAFERILWQAGVIDDSGDWSGDDTHLVIVGDVVDRGPDSRRALDLIMRLEAQALAAGGRVHLVLGNHELMNLTGDLRYVARAEFAAFAADESPAVRAAEFERYRASQAASIDAAAVQADFDVRFPPGFFAHRDAFSADGSYGSWLLRHPLLVLVNETAFVHAGLAGPTGTLGAAGINGQLHRDLVDYLSAMGTLVEARILSPTDDFYSHPAVLDAFEARRSADEPAWPETLAAAAATIRRLHSSLLFASGSPAWYRGNVGCSVLTERDRFLEALGEAGAKRLVIGHTPTRDAVVLTRMDGRLVRIDTGMLNEYYGGRAAAFVIESGSASVLYEGDPAVHEPSAQPRRVGNRPDGMSTHDLEVFLATAEVKNRTETGENTSRVLLRRGETELEAAFIRAARSKVLPDVAAYRLDRMLRLDMVPVTVARRLDGELGSLQYVPPRVITETERSEQGLGLAAWCPLDDQFQAMYVFDSLIFNEGRTPDRIGYSTDNLQLVLVGHERSFSSGRGRPLHLAPVELQLTQAWSEALSALDEAALTAELGDVLDRRRIRALLRRRDALLQTSSVR